MSIKFVICKMKKINARQINKCIGKKHKSTLKISNSFKTIINF
jgi:hypothetical protein